MLCSEFGFLIALGIGRFFTSITDFLFALLDEMRATIRRRLPCPGSSSSSSTTFINASTKHALIPFSTSSGGGRGRGRGGPTQFDFSVPPPGSGRPLPSDTNAHSPEAGAPPFGHGRGRPIPSAPILPSFSSFISSAGRGRPPSTSPTADSDGPKKPIFFRKDSEPPEWAPPTATVTESAATEPQGGSHDLPTSILSVISGAGRGKPLSKVDPDEVPVKEPNRHLKARPHPPQESRPSEGIKRETRLPRDGPGPDGRDGRGRGRGFQARGRGRGRGYGRAGPGRGFRQREERGRFEDDQDDEPGGGLYLGEDNDDEKLARRVGPEVMEKLAEGFEEASLNALPSPAHDVYLDAFHTNCLIEFEPEYLMADFETNPDIDEKPPIPLRDALEKMKPFLMLYEGIKSQEEWDEVMKETMDKAPLIKEIVDYYSGPDRVTAKKQQEELERVAKTLPKSAPASVKEFTNRAVISLQSNPGWGFDKKCQFMDKLVWEVSQQYK